jgi:hypothetical protein
MVEIPTDSGDNASSFAGYLHHLCHGFEFNFRSGGGSGDVGYTFRLPLDNGDRTNLSLLGVKDYVAFDLELTGNNE